VVTLAPEACPEGTEHRALAAGTSITGGACFVVAPSAPPGRELSYSSAPALSIPDDDEAGVRDTIVVPDLVTVAGLTVDVDVAHTYRGDLEVALERAGRRVVLLAQEGGSADDLVQSFAVPDFVGQDGSGEWTLHVVDTAAADIGTLRSWSLRVTAR
jgi:subtilisin-like proprotein convertase family protein